MKALAPNAVTALAMTCGVVAIAVAMQGDPLEASWWILYATLLDRLDGALARGLGVSGPFGAQFDSFADFVSFGIAPAFLFLSAVGGELDPLLLLPMLAYILGCAVRLVRFGLAPGRKVFEGLPSTMAGGVYAVAMNVALRHGLSGQPLLLIFSALLVAFGVAMVLPWLRYGKIGGGNTRFLRRSLVGVFFLCAALIITRRLPELVLGITAFLMVSGPFLTPWDQRKG